MALHAQEMWYVVWFLPGSILGVAVLLAVTWDERRRPGWRAAALAAGGVSAAFLAFNLVALSGLARAAAADAEVAWEGELSRRIPPGSRVLLASVPDAYFALRERGDLELREFLPSGIPVDRDLYRRFIDDCDYWILGASNVSQEVTALALAHGQLVARIPAAGASPLWLVRNRARPPSAPVLGEDLGAGRHVVPARPQS
jgi:hypothetical protein